MDSLLSVDAFAANLRVVLIGAERTGVGGEHENMIEAAVARTVRALSGQSDL